MNSIRLRMRVTLPWSDGHWMVTRSMALSLTVARYPLTLLAPPNAVPIITATLDGIIMPTLTAKKLMLFCRVTSGKHGDISFHHILSTHPIIICMLFCRVTSGKHGDISFQHISPFSDWLLVGRHWLSFACCLTACCLIPLYYCTTVLLYHQLSCGPGLGRGSI